MSSKGVDFFRNVRYNKTQAGYQTAAEHKIEYDEKEKQQKAKPQELVCFQLALLDPEITTMLKQYDDEFMRKYRNCNGKRG